MTPVATACGSTVNTTSETSTTVTVTTDFAVGDRCLVFVACDNSETAGASPLTTFTEPSGGTVSNVRTSTRTSGASNDGVTITLRQFEVTAARPLVTNDLITVNFTSSTAAKCIGLVKVTGIMMSSSTITGNAGTGSGTSASSGAMGTAPGRDDIVFGWVGSEHTTAPGGDSDTTNGSWSDLHALNAGSGTAATNIRLRVQYKVVTANGAQTFDSSTGNSDWACAIHGFTHQASLPHPSPTRSTRALTQAR